MSLMHISGQPASPVLLSSGCHAIESGSVAAESGSGYLTMPPPLLYANEVDGTNRRSDMRVCLRRVLTVAIGLVAAAAIALSVASLGHVGMHTPAHYVAGGMGPHS